MAGSFGARLYNGELSFDFIGKRKRWYALSGVLMLVSIVVLSLQGLHLGIEFKGGASFSVKKVGVSIAAATEAVKSTGLSSEPVVQLIGTDKVRVQTGILKPGQSAAIQDALAAKFGVVANDVDYQLIGPSWGAEITKKALYGLIGFLIVVVLYLALAFEPKMAIAAIIAVIHDVFITVGIYALVDSK
jgi:preprotein translocase subunit SecF